MDISTVLNYVEIPLQARFSFRVADNAIPYLIGGPFIQKCAFGKEIRQVCDQDDFYYTEFYSDEFETKLEVEDFELGFAIGAGIEVPLTSGSVIFEWRLAQSASKVDIVEKNGRRVHEKNATNRTLSFEVGYTL